MKRWAKRFFLFLLFLQAFVSLWRFGFTAFQLTQFEKKEWVKAEGEILSSQVVIPQGKRFVYVPSVRFYFIDDEETIHAERVYLGSQESHLRFLAERITRRYLPGQKLTVYYPTWRPHLAILDRSMSIYTFRDGIFGLLCLAAAGFFTFRRSTSFPFFS